MTQPLALVLYERLLPGSQLVNRLQDLKYRVQAVTKPGELVETAKAAKPMIVLVDLGEAPSGVLSAIQSLKQDNATQHLPVMAFATHTTDELKAQSQAAGVTLFVSETAALNYLPQLLEQALQID